MTDTKTLINQYITNNDITGLIDYSLKTLQATGISRAKIIKNFNELLEIIQSIPNTLKLLISICESTIEWATKSNKNLFKQQIEYKLAQFYFKDNQCPKSLSLIASLLRNAKQMDDKLFAVELQLLEANVHRKVKNVAKARGAMTGAKVDANSIFIQPVLQGEIDMVSGFINGMEKDYTTAASYFYEAFENYYSLNMKNEMITALKYLILMKIMQKRIGDIENLMVNKHIVIHSDNINVVALNEIAKAYEKRNIDEYNRNIEKYQNELVNDEFVKENLEMLYNELLQENICRILEPYSCIELEHIAKMIKLDVKQIEKIIRLMIIEDKINGIIDQNRGILILYEDINSNRILSSGVELIGELNKLVDTLSEKAVKVIQDTSLSHLNDN